MRVQFKMTKDQKLLRRLYKKAFPRDDMRDFSKDVSWVILSGKKRIGFCSVKVTSFNEVFLASCGVFKPGHGIQKKAIQHRIRWAKRNGYRQIVTYTSKDNYKSIANLIKCGFLMYNPSYAYAGRNFLYFSKKLEITHSI